MSGPQFIGLSTGRAGSRYLAECLSRAGVKTVHEKSESPKLWKGGDALGEVTAWFAPHMDDLANVQVWHFARHPQPFVASLIKFGFWGMCHPAIHPHLRRTHDPFADSFRYWVDWNQRIMDGAPEPRRTTFRIEDVSGVLVGKLAKTIGVDVDTSGLDFKWNERQEFAPIPDEVADEVFPLMEALGYARSC